jgi:hypothetical protein
MGKPEIFNTINIGDTEAENNAKVYADEKFSELNYRDILDPDKLTRGTTDAGFYGIVKSRDFITGDELASRLGITEGNSQFSDVDWLKFSWNGKTLYTPMKTIRNSISWDHLYQKGAVYGTGSTISSGEQFMLDNDTNYNGTDGTVARVAQDAQVTIQNVTFNVRLFKGASNDPTNNFMDDDRDSIGPANEWNLLMLPIHEFAKTGGWNYSQYVPDDLDNYNIGFTNRDLGTDYTFNLGSRTWCQEVSDHTAYTYTVRVGRGKVGASYLGLFYSYGTYEYGGWRPVLEIAD